MDFYFFIFFFFYFHLVENITEGIEVGKGVIMEIKQFEELFYKRNRKVDEGNQQDEGYEFCKSATKSRKYKRSEDRADKKSDKTSINSQEDVAIIIEYFQNNMGSENDDTGMYEEYNHQILVILKSCDDINRGDEKIS